MKTSLPINLSFEEISSMSSKGTLEQYILSNGYRYQDFLLFAINSANEKLDSLESEFDEETLLDRIDQLEEEVTGLQDGVASLQEQLDEES